MMEQDLAALQRLLARLGRRERRLLLARAGLQGGAALLLVAVAAGALLSAGALRLLALGLVASLGGLAVYLAVAWPLLRRWRVAGDPRAQARRLEAQVPDLRSRLLTALDASRQSTRVSVALLARAVGRAAALATTVPPQAVYPARALRAPGAVFGLSVVASLVAGVALPIGPWDAMLALWTGNIAAARMADAVLEDGGPQAVIGDIVLRYVYPDYTGLQPVEIQNSDGTIHAPPGTAVTLSARTAEVFEAASLQSYERPPVDAELRGGRDLTASLTVEGEGVWRVLLFRGRTAVRSPDYRIVVEADAPPVITAAQSSLEVAVDQPLSLGWEVSDDYGVDRVLLEVEQNGDTQTFELRNPLDFPLSLQGAVDKAPRDLGLKPGARATLRLVAYDNDPAATPDKRGVSADIVLHVTGASGAGGRPTQQLQELRDALVAVLADFLEESSPPALDHAGLARWSTAARGRFDPTRELMARLYDGEPPDSIEVRYVHRALEDAARLFRFTQTAFDPALERPPSERDLQTFQDLHQGEVASLEMAVWILDSLIRANALDELARRAEEVAQEARDLANLAQQDPDANAMLSRLDQLERQLRRLSEQANRLSEGQLREFTNARTQEASDLIQEIRKAIAEGRMQDAAAMLQRLADLLQQMSEGLSEQLAQAQESDDALQERMAQLDRDLDQLQKDQAALADKLAAARDAQDPSLGDFLDAWKKLDPLAARAVALSCGAAALPGDGTGWRAGTIRKLAMACSASEDLQGAVRARDRASGLDQVGLAEAQARMARDQLANEIARPRLEGEDVPLSVPQAVGQVDELKVTLGRIREILQAMEEREAGRSPEQQAVAQKLAQDQQKLEQRQQALGEELKRVEQALPTGDGSASEAMEGASGAMQRAEQALEQGDGVGGEGHQRYAAEQIGAARQILQQQQEEARQMQQAMGRRGQGDGKGKNNGGSNGAAQPSQSIEIPAPESFQTPEAYRRALLEGMRGEVPEEYEALKRRYYEDLVRQ